MPANTPASDMPENVRLLLESNPELLKVIADPDFINKVTTGMARAATNGDWCVACGASAGVAPAEMAGNPDPLTAKELLSIGSRLVAHAQKMQGGT